MSRRFATRQQHSYTHQLDTQPLIKGLAYVTKTCVVSAQTTANAELPAVCLPTTGVLAHHLQELEDNPFWMMTISNSECIFSLCGEKRVTGLTDKNLRVLTAWIVRNRLRIRSIWLINNQISEMKPFAELCCRGCLVPGFHLHLHRGSVNPSSLLNFLTNIDIRFTIIRVEENDGVACHLLKNKSSLDVCLYDVKPHLFTVHNIVVIGSDQRQNNGTWYRDTDLNPMFQQKSISDSDVTLDMFIRPRKTSQRLQKVIRSLRSINDTSSPSSASSGKLNNIDDEMKSVWSDISTRTPLSSTSVMLV